MWLRAIKRLNAIKVIKLKTERAQTACRGRRSSSKEEEGDPGSRRSHDADASAPANQQEEVGQKWVSCWRGLGAAERLAFGRRSLRVATRASGRVQAAPL